MAGIPDEDQSQPDPQGPDCWICLHDGPSEVDGGLPLRNYACRGDSAGFAHLSCLAEYAQNKCDESYEQHGYNTHGYTGAASTPWFVCSNCKHPFGGEVSYSMSEKFVNNTEQLHDLSYLRYEALIQFADRKSIIGDHDGAQDICEKLLAGFGSSTILSGAHQHQELEVWSTQFMRARILKKLAEIFFDKARVDNLALSLKQVYAQKSLIHLQECKEIWIELDGPEHWAVLECECMMDSLQEIIAELTSEQKPCKKSQEELATTLSRARKIYNSNCQICGEDSAVALRSVANLARALYEDEKASEAAELLEENILKARRNLGPTHILTASMEEFAQVMDANDRALTAAREKLATEAGDLEGLLERFLEEKEEERAAYFNKENIRFLEEFIINAREILGPNHKALVRLEETVQKVLATLSQLST